MKYRLTPKPIAWKSFEARLVRAFDGVAGIVRVCCSR